MSALYLLKTISRASLISPKVARTLAALIAKSSKFLSDRAPAVNSASAWDTSEEFLFAFRF